MRLKWLPVVPMKQEGRTIKLIFPLSAHINTTWFKPFTLRLGQSLELELEPARRSSSLAFQHERFFERSVRGLAVPDPQQTCPGLVSNIPAGGKSRVP